ncbi:uncharacterized protein PHALS_14996 [Plasmopara halstedii]|uniref:Uncharacterized protein n=1 Tax=Plasmopara halstedii TaxID=4781 RepID=A0A0P1B102_PLAHL|nr:uncharacterized protein PHALS_14996 [Plasmopara halstedii]CEG47368.1 hypothetical protein PHALS_14996 [Plasmopara halstedii]|eukprot:XP_024583737.1 hypothetical protein PHALS_14996 [Plasmopara halstedii]
MSCCVSDKNSSMKYDNIYVLHLPLETLRKKCYTVSNLSRRQDIPKIVFTKMLHIVPQTTFRRP